MPVSFSLRTPRRNHGWGEMGKRRLGITIFHTNLVSDSSTFCRSMKKIQGEIFAMRKSSCLPSFCSYTSFFHSLIIPLLTSFKSKPVQFLSSCLLQSHSITFEFYIVYIFCTDSIKQSISQLRQAQPKQQQR